MQNLRLLGSLVLILAGLSGCGKHEAASPIVQKAEASGSGPLAEMPETNNMSSAGDAAA